MVVIWVEHDDQLVSRQRIERAVVAVGVEELITPRNGSAYSTNTERVVHARSDVNRPFIIENSYFGALARRCAFMRLLLTKIRDRCRFRPRCLIEVAVDSDGSCQRCGSRDRQARRACLNCLRAGCDCRRKKIG